MTCRAFSFLEGGAQWWANRFEPGAAGNGKGSTPSPSANLMRVAIARVGLRAGPGRGIAGASCVTKEHRQPIHPSPHLCMQGGVG